MLGVPWLLAFPFLVRSILMWSPRRRIMDTTPAQLIAWLSEARQRTLQLVADLDDDQLLGPRLEIVNPLLWEIGHVAWFQEKWVLRRGGEPSIRADADDLYDSAAVAHDRRWELPLPDRDDTSAVHGWSARESR